VTLLAGILALVLQQPAQAATCGTYSLTLAVSGSALARSGDGLDTAHTSRGTNTVTATITNNGAPDSNETVAFLKSDNTASLSPGVVVTSADPSQASYTSSGPGKYNTTVTAGDHPGTDTITVTFTPVGGTPCTAQASITQFGHPTQVSVSLSPNPTPVSPHVIGENTVTATATVTDAGGRRVKDEEITTTISAIDPPTQPANGIPANGATVSDTVETAPLGNDNGDGTYTDTIDVSTSPSRQTVKMTITSGASLNLAGTSVLTQYGPAKSVTLSLSPTSIPANGAATSTATATVRDAVGNAVPGAGVSFIQTSGPAVTFNPASGSTNTGGIIQSTVTAGTTTGSASITALSCGSSCQNAQSLTLTAPAITTVSVSMNPTTIVADGTSKSVATVTVLDQAGTPINNATVTVTRSGAATSYTAAAQGGGKYTATLTSLTTPQTETITAAAGGKSGTAQLTESAAPTTTTTQPAQSTQGYSLVGEDGSLYAFGNAKNLGDMKGTKLNAPIIGVAYTPGGSGYWLVAKDGGIFTFGDADFYGSMGGTKLNSPVIGMAATPTGKGYWLFAGDGGIFTFGDAQFFGSMGDKKLNAPVINMEPVKSGNGYWLVAADGGIFTFGNAQFYGSMGDQKINQPVFDMTSTDTDHGYWLVARDGGIFSFGDAETKFYGSAVNDFPRPTKIIGMDATPDNQGYWIADADGKVYKYGNAQDLGDRYLQANPAPMVAFSAVRSVKP
jgi:hypothetical protein